MPNRREFLKGVAGATAGMAFVGCGLVNAQSGSALRRRQVVVGGRRVKTVDIHTHCAVPETLALMGLSPNNPGLIMAPERLGMMDEQGIDVQVLSCPSWYSAEQDQAREFVKIQNEKLAGLCAAHPDRFVGLGTVALQYPDLAAEQLDEGVKKLRLRGASIGTTVTGEELSSPKFHPFWAKAEELGVPVSSTLGARRNSRNACRATAS